MLDFIFRVDPGGGDGLFRSVSLQRGVESGIYPSYSPVVSLSV